jgi:hypothetical protein
LKSVTSACSSGTGLPRNAFALSTRISSVAGGEHGYRFRDAVRSHFLLKEAVLPNDGFRRLPPTTSLLGGQAHYFSGNFFWRAYHRNVPSLEFDDRPIAGARPH